MSFNWREILAQIKTNSKKKWEILEKKQKSGRRRMQEHKDQVRLAWEFFSHVVRALQTFWDRVLKQTSFDAEIKLEKLPP